METKLWKVIDLLDKDGWCKGVALDRFGRRCLTGAMLKVGCESEATFVMHAMEQEFPERSCSNHFGNKPNNGSILEWFNDHTDTTYDDIKLVVTKAAMKVEETVE